MSDRMAVARAYEKALFAGDMAAVGRLFTDDVVYWIAGAPPLGGEWRGRDAVLGAFESRVFGIGPHLGYIFPLGSGHQGYLNLKGYWEFEADRRAEGWNTWLTFSISPAPHRTKPE